MGKITAPQPIQKSSKLESFDCGDNVLNEWLKKRAYKNENSGASRTYVVCSENNLVIGYYAIATGSVMLKKTPSKIKRNMPDPVPVIILGRLAVDKNWQNSGIGKGLLKDAVQRAMLVATQAGVKALLVHAISDSAKQFYMQYGFIESPLDSMVLMLPL